MNYVLMSNKYQDSYFSADDDKEAELYVEREYTTEDGKMNLYRLVPVCEWPEHITEE